MKYTPPSHFKIPIHCGGIASYNLFVLISRGVLLDKEYICLQIKEHLTTKLICSFSFYSNTILSVFELPLCQGRHLSPL